MALGLAQAAERLGELKDDAMPGRNEERVSPESIEGLFALIRHFGYDEVELDAVAHQTAKEMVVAASSIKASALDYGISCFIEGLLLGAYFERFGDAS